MLNPIMPFEAFGKFPDDQKRLIDFIREPRVPGVLFVSGDRHHTELIKRVEPWDVSAL
jgi:alkaline phosphatase D